MGLLVTILLVLAIVIVSAIALCQYIMWHVEGGDCCMRMYPYMLIGRCSNKLYKVRIDGDLTTHICNKHYEECNIGLVDIVDEKERE